MRYDHEQLIHRRMELGWTQTDLAEKVGVTSQLISLIELGLRQSPKTIKALADVMGLDMGSLIVRNGKGKSRNGHK